MAIIKDKKRNADKGTEKGNSHILKEGMEISAINLEKSMDIPEKRLKWNYQMIQKTYYRFLYKENEISMSKKHLYSHSHCSIIYNSQDTRTTYIFINEQKKNRIHIQNTILFCQKEE